MCRCCRLFGVLIVVSMCLSCLVLLVENIDVCVSLMLLMFYVVSMCFMRLFCWCVCMSIVILFGDNGVLFNCMCFLCVLCISCVILVV